VRIVTGTPLVGIAAELGEAVMGGEG